MITLTYADVEAAAQRLAGIAHRTPVLTSRTADERTGARLFFKCENLQRMGAFKFRGAYNALARFTPAQRAGGAIAYSAGNHAQGIALSAKLLGMKAVIVMPKDAPALKIAATRGYGAEVVLYDRYTESREAIGAAIAAERGMTLVPPFDHADVIAGQGTAAKELIEETGPLDALVVCVGGGGLIAGGAPVDVAAGGIAVDSLGARRVGAIAFATARATGVTSVLVSDDAIAAARRALWDGWRIAVEPGAAAAYAALHGGAYRPAPDERVVVVLCGANTDPATLA